MSWALLKALLKSVHGDCWTTTMAGRTPTPTIICLSNNYTPFEVFVTKMEVRNVETPFEFARSVHILSTTTCSSILVIFVPLSLMGWNKK